GGARGPPRLRAQPPCGGCRGGHRGGRPSHPRGAERDAVIPARDARLAIPLRVASPLTAGAPATRHLHSELSRYIVGISQQPSPEAPVMNDTTAADWFSQYGGDSWASAARRFAERARGHGFDSRSG